MLLKCLTWLTYLVHPWLVRWNVLMTCFVLFSNSNKIWSLRKIYCYKRIIDCTLQTLFDELSLDLPPGKIPVIVGLFACALLFVALICKLINKCRRDMYEVPRAYHRATISRRLRSSSTAVTDQLEVDKEAVLLPRRLRHLIPRMTKIWISPNL